MTTRTLPYDQFLQALESGHVTQIVYLAYEGFPGMLRVTLEPNAERGEGAYEVHLASPPSAGEWTLWAMKGIQIRTQNRRPWSKWGYPVLKAALGLVALSIGFTMATAWGFYGNFSLKQAPNSIGGKSAEEAELARRFLLLPDKDTTPTRLEDVIGNEAPKQEVTEYVEVLKNPGHFKRMGIRVPSGILFTGPPGCGKTHLARAIACSAGVPFISVPGSYFEEILIGKGAQRVKELFKLARKHAPCIIFIDELESIGGARSAYRESRGCLTLNQLLSEMDGLASGKLEHPVLVVAATNYPEKLDSALTRPGRFDKTVYFLPPDAKERTELLEYTVARKGMPCADDVKFEELAWLSQGRSNAELVAWVNEAACFAARREADFVTQEDFVSAFWRQRAGLPRKKDFDPETRERLASQLAGETLVAWHLSETGTCCPTRPAQVSLLSPLDQGVQYSPNGPEAPPRDTADQFWSPVTYKLSGRIAETCLFGESNPFGGPLWDKRALGARRRALACLHLGFFKDFPYRLDPLTGFGKIHRQPSCLGACCVGLQCIPVDLRPEAEALIWQATQETQAFIQRYLQTNQETLKALTRLILERETLTQTELEPFFQSHHLQAPDSGPSFMELCEKWFAYNPPQQNLNAELSLLIEGSTEAPQCPLVSKS